MKRDLQHTNGGRDIHEASFRVALTLAELSGDSVTER